MYLVFETLNSVVHVSSNYFSVFQRKGGSYLCFCVYSNFFCMKMLLLHIFSRKAFIYDIGRAKTGMERGSLKERVFLNLASLAVYLIFILCYFYNVFIFPKSIRT